MFLFYCCCFIFLLYYHIDQDLVIEFLLLLLKYKHFLNVFFFPVKYHPGHQSISITILLKNKKYVVTFKLDQNFS